MRNADAVVGPGSMLLSFVSNSCSLSFRRAWSKTSNQPLPENIDQFIVNIIEPNFTTGLLVLLSFSVCLGAFAAAQLGSSAASYTEDD
jgi:hypothetical protein